MCFGEVSMRASALFIVLRDKSLLGATAALSMTAAVSAQPVFDGSTGGQAPGAVVTDTIDVSQGTRAGGNVFHSFSSFSIGAGESVTLTDQNPATPVNNIINRVTGTDISEINGTLRSTVEGADVYLINPNGIVVGSGSVIDVPAGFHLSTADELHFEDGEVLQATVGSSTFSSATPTAFGFTGAAVGNITITEGQIIGKPGANISLVGGNITLQDGDVDGMPTRVETTDGSIHLFATTTPATVSIRPAPSDQPASGTIALFGGADATQIAVTTTNTPSGAALRLQAENIIAARAEIVSLVTGAAEGADVIVRAGGELNLVAGALIVAIGDGDGAAGLLDITAHALTIDPLGTQLRTGLISKAFSTGRGGEIQVDARSIWLSGFGAEISSDSESSAAGGDIRIGSRSADLGELFILNGALILSNTHGRGAAGIVDVFANELVVDTLGSLAETGLASLTNSVSMGAGGDVLVDARTIVIRGSGAQITTATFEDTAGGDVWIGSRLSVDALSVLAGGSVNASSLAAGAGGSIFIGYQDANRPGEIGQQIGRIDVAGHDPNDLRPSAINASSGGSGPSGNLSLAASQEISLRDGGQILSIAFGLGLSGDAFIDAPTVVLDGFGSIIATATPGDRDGGNIWIGSRPRSDTEVQIRNNAGISTSAFGEGRSGSIFVGIQDPFQTGIYDGRVTRVEVLSNGFISTASYGSGLGGDIEISASEAFWAIDRGRVSAGGLGTGGGGDIFIDAPIVLVDGGAFVATATSGTKRGGDISIGSRSIIDLVRVSNEGVVFSSTAGSGDGGGINVFAKNVEVLSSSLVDASSGIPGSGGDSTGNPGDILVQAQSFRAAGASVFSVTGEYSSTPGSVTIEAGNLSLQNGAAVVTSTLGHAPAGEISLRASNLEIAGARTFVLSTAILQDADAGQITIGAVDFRVADGAAIGTFAANGAGGQISIDWTHVGRIDQGLIATNVLGSSEGAGTITFGRPLLSTNLCPNCDPPKFNPYAGLQEYAPNDPLKVLVIGDGSLLDASARGADGAPGGSIEIARGVSVIASGGLLPADVSSETGTQGEVTTPVAFAPSKAISLLAPERKVTMRCGITHDVSTLSDSVSGRASVDREPSSLLPAGLPSDLDGAVTAAVGRLCGA